MNSSEDPLHRNGIAPIKPEYIIKKENIRRNIVTEATSEDTQDDTSKKGRITRTRESNKRYKERTVKTFTEVKRLCHKTAVGEDCDFDQCKYDHDLNAFLEIKEENLGDRCLASLGIVEEKNGLTYEMQRLLRKNLYSFPKSDVYITEIQEEISKQLKIQEQNKLAKLQVTGSVIDKGDQIVISQSQNVTDTSSVEENIHCSTTELIDKNLGQALKDYKGIFETKSDDITLTNDFGESSDTPDVPLRACEKKKISFKNKLYLAPLTTVGNLPFRRICKEFGADITCGEMAIATNLLQGQQSEWALLKRHVSEDMFGVQICGCKAQHMVKCAEILSNEIEVDFIDVNLGCPIDLVYNKGGGTALLRHDGKLGKILRGMNKVTDIPITVKLRTGIQDDIPVAHKLVPKFEKWGVSMATLHGRSRQQRYTKLADWQYISKVSYTVNEMPLLGNGDVLGYTDYYEHIEKHRIDGIMIARGALIKPWIFDEIKSKRHYDISSGERLDILRKYCNYGMEHWGSDSIGINQTRRFFCEWMSFLYRYIPVGLLEVLPQRINERPPSFRGRDELETLLASENSNDWVKLSEMFLGPAHESFKFVPKHVSNSYSYEG
ncbi:16076_t:CDS:10 [Cetraspora pellucida]|uniref:tRNA-dihydrouridine(47) synthase [NAD(P)(+)] n=1 Tax=Cetraspora pellucida TaxID=1433469 RepID=A0A9N9NLV0_9GLOM|nr:16076_t:CDS:10 [Cetraspora pellucida]